MAKIYITEAQLKSMIAEALSEVSYDKVKNAGDVINYGKWDGGYERPSLSEIDEALTTLESTLSSIYRDSPQARKFEGYLSEMRAFFERKQAQSISFDNAAAEKEQEYKQYLLNLARSEFGYDGNDLTDFVNQLAAKDNALYDNGDFSDPNWNSFLNKISDPDIRGYAESNL